MAKEITMQKARSRIASRRRKEMRRTIKHVVSIFSTVFLLSAALYFACKYLILSANAEAPTRDIEFIEKPVEVVVEKQIDRRFETDRQQYQAMIVEIFGDSGSITAQGIVGAESGYNPNREGIHKAGKYEWSTDTYKGECSIGLFQINLAEDGCNGKWVHAAKVPGETMEEKIAWLKVPQNNIKFAKEEIFNKSGFQPWSTYTNGSYKNIK